MSIARVRDVRRSAWLIASLSACIAGAQPAAAQEWGSRYAPGLRQLQTVVPRSGPPGTLVRIESENLPPQYKVHVGTGAVGAGFEDAVEAQIGEWGAISVTIPVPAYATWDKPIFFVAFDGNFSPIALSDPFHVTDASGRIRRQGRITDEGGSCVTMRDSDDYLYTLAGVLDDLRPGDDVTVEGTYSESGVCLEGNTIQVTRVGGGL